MSYTNEEILKRIEKAKKNKAKLTHITDKSNLTIEDKVKLALCKHFVQYINEKRIKAVDLSKELGIPTSRISEIVNYKIKSYSVENLLGYLQLLAEHSPRVREYLHFFEQAAELPYLTAAKTKKLSKTVKTFVNKEAENPASFAY